MQCLTHWPLLTLLPLSLFFICVYFSPRWTLPRVMNLCMQTYIEGKQFLGKQISLGQQILGIQHFGGLAPGKDCVKAG